MVEVDQYTLFTPRDVKNLGGLYGCSRRRFTAYLFALQ